MGIETRVSQLAPPKRKSKQSNEEETRLSMSTENYLLSIFRLQEQQPRLSLTQLADHLRTLPEAEGLGTSLPSVSAMIRRMSREGLVESDQDRGVVLTGDGRVAAESIVRRHRLAERMVVDILGMDLAKSHMEAHRLEHAISPELEERIVEKLGNPSTCPFGHPVPGSGYTSPSNAVSLDKAEPGAQMVIDRVPEDDQSLLEYMVANDLIPGARFHVEEAAASRGVITLVCDGRNLAFSYEIASLIWACPAE